MKYTLKKHKFKLVFICKYSWVFVLKKAMKRHIFKNIFSCEGKRGKKLRKLDIYRDKQLKIVENKGKVG